MMRADGGIDRDALFAALNEGILDERAGAFRRNLARNRDAIRRHGGLRAVVPLIEGRHVTIVGAGPSLEGALGPLGRYHHRQELCVIAADMALRPLARNGIRPAFVISCETKPVDFFAGVDTTGMHLLAFSCMSSVNLRRWRGRVSFYNWMIHNDRYDPLWRDAGEELGFVATGNLVTTQAVALALGCRIASLALFGNDLGFRRRYYAAETVRFHETLCAVDRLLPLPTAEFRTARRAAEYALLRGNDAYCTNSQFLAAKLWLEELFSKQAVPIFDCSDPGCSGSHAIKLAPKEYFARFDRKPRRR